MTVERRDGERKHPPFFQRLDTQPASIRRLPAGIFPLAIPTQPEPIAFLRACHLRFFLLKVRFRYSADAALALSPIRPEIYCLSWDLVAAGRSLVWTSCSAAAARSCCQRSTWLG